MNGFSEGPFYSFKNASLFYRLALFVFSSLLPFTTALALNEAPQTFTLDGRLYQTGTTSPLLDSAAKITVQILDPTGHCVLYEETQTANTSGTEGYFNINVGSDTSSAKRTVNDPGRTMAQIFQNTVSISGNNASGLTCTAGLYIPTAGAVRYFRIIVTPSATNIADTLSPDLILDSVPNAMVAQSVQGLERSSILQANNSGATVLTQANLEALFTTPGYTNLQAILGGNFIRTDSSGAALPAYAATPSGVATGDIWYDSTTNQIKYQSNSGVQTVGAGGAGTISSLTMGSSMSVNGSVAGTISNGSGTIDLSNTGVSAGTYTKVTVDTKGRVTAGTISLVEGDIPNLTSAGKVSGNTITAGTISGSAGINTSGNLISTATVSGLTVQATNLRVHNGSNYVQLSAPALAGNVSLTLPVDDGNTGEVLSTNGSGVLSWVSTLTNTLASGKIFVGNGSNVATAVDISGDGALSNAGALTIDSGTTANRLVRLDGSAKLPAVDGSALTNLSASAISGTLPISKGGTAATSFAANAVIVSNGTASALQALNCTVGQVLTFDVSGYTVCGAGGATGFVNGGNSFAGNASLGTNDAYKLSLETSGAERMVILANGNVGIGESNPTATLDVFTSATALTGTSVQANYMEANPISHSNGNYYASNSYATKEGSSDLRSLIAVYGWADHWGTAGTISYLYGGSFGVEAGSGKYVTNAVGVQSYAAGWGRTTNVIGYQAEVESYGSATPPTKLAGADLTVQVQNGGGVDIMGTNIHTWHNGGGTFTNMYGTKIDMSTGSSGPLTNMYGSRISMSNTSTGAVSNFYGLYIDTITHSVAPTLKYGIYQAGANDKNYFAGSIGVGISVPTTKLDISGTSGTTLKIVDGNQAAGRVLTSDANGVASWASQAGGSNTQIQYNNSGALAGSVNFIWDNTTSTFTVTGDINYSGVLTDTSDRRLKKDIEKLDEVEITKRLMQVDVFRFRMKSPENAPLELGVMAQDLEAVFPELVRTANDKIKSKSVNYIGLIAPLIGAAKQLNQENASLKREIASVRDQSDQLRETIENGKRETRILFFAVLGLLGIGLYLQRRKSAS